MKYLPLGNQDFKELIDKNYIYVDKTKWLYDLLKVPKGIYFLSRPRRFGKTLTVSTLYHLFKGRKELFKDTYIYDKWDFAERPVVRLDMSRVISSQGLEGIEEGLNIIVNENASKNGVELVKNKAPYAFGELIQKLDNPALLIDEYDKLILNNIHKPDYVDQIREVLREFYGVIKSHESEFSFIFMTGISKFSKMSIFSELNNLTDLTLRKNYADMLGLSDEEVDRYFRDYIDKVKKERSISEDEFWIRLKDYYNGFSFDGEHFLYNPYSILNFFDTGEFRNYWFESGTPSFLVKWLKDKDITNDEIVDQTVDEDIFNSYEIENAPVVSFLFQSGYLTIKDKNEFGYTLNYPNEEVRRSFNKFFLEARYNIDLIKSKPYRIKIVKGLRKNNFSQVFNQFQSLISNIPYNLFSKKESYYHTVLLTLLWAAGIKTTAEDMSNLGRSDIVIEFGDDIYILELKRDSAEKALQQIKEKGYYKKFTGKDKNIYLVGLEIDDEQRNLVNYELEKIK